MRRRSVAMAALVCAALAGACSGGPRMRAGDAPLARDAEANRIAKQARRAQVEGDRAKAEELYRQALQVSANLHAVWNNLGLLMLEDGRYIDAVEAFKRAADLSPSDPRPLHNIGIAYDRSGWQQKALENYLQALERDPRDVIALRGSVSSARMLGLIDNATLDRARTALMIDNDPDWRRIYERETSRIEGELRARRSRSESSQG